MKSTVRDAWSLMAVAVLLCLATSAFAGTVSMQINDPPSNNILDGIYVGAYSATNIGTGAQTQIICDDFKDDSNYNPASYTVHSFTNLVGTVWGAGAMTQYEEAAWLTLGMLQQSGAQQGYYSYAIWATFDPSGVASWLTSYGDSAACNTVFGNGSWGKSGCTAGSGGLLASAAGQQYTQGEFANFLILTPTCGAGPGTCQEQEFFELQPVPEGGSAMTYLGLAGIVCFGAMFYVRRQRAAAGMA
jgi:hypothetical protein